MDFRTAFYHIEEVSPGTDPNLVLEILKAQERVEYNESNQVFTYVVSLVEGV
jgi:hypothetical protein